MSEAVVRQRPAGTYLFFPFSSNQNRDEDAEKDKEYDPRAAHYVFFQQALRDLYHYHLEYPWDTTIRATVEMLAKKFTAESKSCGVGGKT